MSSMQTVLYENKTDITEAMIDELSKNIRQEDEDELYALGHNSIRDAISVSVKSSSKVWADFADGKLLLIAGVAPHPELEGVGVPWMLATDLLEKHTRYFLKGCREGIRKAAAGFDLLINIIDTRNTKTIGWLKALGFEITETIPVGPYNTMCHVFSMKIGKEVPDVRSTNKKRLEE
ncbi:MAG: hypothetical protein ACYCZQ_03305 [Burkholderiales bacterium]